jgi:hemerythrin-like metal-binding protein
MHSEATNRRKFSETDHPWGATVQTIPWKSRYSMGIEALDEQRAAYISILNELHAGTIDGFEHPAISMLLAKLKGVMEAHFSVEEESMSSAGFVGLAHHRAMHMAMVRQVDQFVTRNDSFDVTVPLPLLNFLRGWFAIHMLGDDLLFAQWLKESDAVQR